MIKRIRSDGIAHISYFVGSGHEAVVIDPRRDCQIYFDLAKEQGMKIRYIFETHRNEDYVIGSKELAQLTGARIYHGTGLDFKYGERVIAVFTGDALFVGEVGRVDFYGREEIPRLARNLYDSIFKRILPLGDGVILYPAHGAGSVCGGGISEREESTLGLERLQNPILKKTKEQFVKFKVAEHHYQAPYFRKMEQYNLNGPPLLGGLPDTPGLSPKQFKKKMELDAIVVDTRTPPAFGGVHIKGSLSIWLRGLPSYAGWALPYNKDILLVLEDKQQVETAVRYLIRLGYDRIVGYLCGKAGSCGIEAWYNEGFPIEHLDLLSIHKLKARLEEDKDMLVLDVRGGDEWNRAHIDGSLHIYLGHLMKRLNRISKDQPLAIICNTGNRSSLGASMLYREGYKHVHNVLGGMNAWKRAGYSTVT